MTLRAFLDAAYAVQVREATRLGIPLLDALARFKHMAAASLAKDEAAVEVGESQNERSMKALEARLAGVTRRG